MSLKILVSTYEISPHRFLNEEQDTEGPENQSRLLNANRNMLIILTRMTYFISFKTLDLSLLNDSIIN